MQKAVIQSVVIAFLSLLFFVVGLYGTLFTSDGFFYVFGQITSMYLLIFHPAIFFVLGRTILKQSNIRNASEMLIFNMLILVALPIIYVLIPVFMNAYSGFGDITALEFVFVIFEFAALLTAIVFFVRYAKRMIFDKMIPKDLYAIHHFYIGALVYFYFVRLTIISSLLVSGAGAI